MRKSGEKYQDEADGGEVNFGESTLANLQAIMGGADPRYVNAVSTEMENAEASGGQQRRSSRSVESSDTRERVTATGRKTVAPKKINLPKEVNVENILVELYSVHDKLVDLFEKVGMDAPVSQDIISVIDDVAVTIAYVGGTVEKFDAYKHVSGLDVPDFVKNAQKVIETTGQCYRMGKIKEYFISDDGKRIEIIFSGISKGVKFEALGKITAQEWVGNEAIDYVHCKGGGKISVKTFEKGKWTEKGKDAYRIEMEFLEGDIAENKPETEEPKNNITQIKEEIINTENNTVKDVKENTPSLPKEDEEQEIGDFPITEN